MIRTSSNVTSAVALVVHDEPAVPPRAQLGDGRDCVVPDVCAEQRLQRVRRPGRAARFLDLGRGVVARQLQLPDAAAALGASPQRDP